ncbi:predicted protein [Plenodomus lingam JN3]|uniref:Predicted protein n=1 Tax=Leptosphaeria maculans (strain JN3 / isolate v23.1.3 / race Av1-4-5-6-7-8) TaxID=985895 RepID=E5A4N3_LEPMJ|nr:predicted protein [Plenodomus lingam JN3]CBX98581.1 predicted protein [Plenodomus lingam JN3]
MVRRLTAVPRPLHVREWQDSRSHSAAVFAFPSSFLCVEEQIVNLHKLYMISSMQYNSVLSIAFSPTHHRPLQMKERCLAHSPQAPANEGTLPPPIVEPRDELEAHTETLARTDLWEVIREIDRRYGAGASS